MDKLFLDIMNPRGDVEIRYQKPAPRLSDLKGKTIALIDNRKAGARSLLDQIKALLEKDFQDVKFINISKKHNEQHRIEKYMEQIQGADAAVYSTGD